MHNEELISLVRIFFLAQLLQKTPTYMIAAKEKIWNFDNKKHTALDLPLNRTERNGIRS